MCVCEHAVILTGVLQTCCLFLETHMLRVAGHTHTPSRVSEVKSEFWSSFEFLTRDKQLFPSCHRVDFGFRPKFDVHCYHVSFIRVNENLCLLIQLTSKTIWTCICVFEILHMSINEQ